MPRRVPLPPDLVSRPFSVGEATALGLTPGRLDGPDLVIPFRGVRDRRVPEPLTLEQRCRQYAVRMKPWQFFSHETALALQGVPVPRHPYVVRIHVASHRPQREPRLIGVVGHRLQTRDDAWVEVSGLRVEHVVRAWRQAGMTWPMDDLIAAADHIVGRTTLASLDDLRTELIVMKGRGARRLLRALDDVRAGSESPEESRLRLILGRAGLPEPEVNWVLRDENGRHVARLDLAFRKWRVGAEYDGRHHELDERQFARDVDREADVRRQGWELVRVLRHHLRGDGRAAVRLVREALERRGWRP
ncbi:MAG TPA: hypothetical protein VNT50_10445 [Microbacterium sp.]|uniref:hypothetical protein n=1 Tax=Microbacterium sp. TaxID=51671 RepID=UPI002C5799CD|nr:hypothetical protein [Microbacterium sp.]HWI31900.1 hypothetical protein [Microbacterium sp.]